MDTKEEKPSDFLQPEEREILESSIKYRNLMTGHLFDKGNVPDEKYFRIANEILEKNDIAALRMAELRQKQKHHEDDSQLAEEAIAMTKEAIRRRIKGYDKTSIEDGETGVDDNAIPVDIVEGEMELAPKLLNVDSYLGE